MKKCFFKSVYSLKQNKFYLNLVNNTCKYLCQLDNDSRSSSNNNKEIYNNEYLEMIFNQTVLKYKIPAFKFYSSQIEIIDSPTLFYTAILVI